MVLLLEGRLGWAADFRLGDETEQRLCLKLRGCPIRDRATCMGCLNGAEIFPWLRNFPRLLRSPWARMAQERFTAQALRLLKNRGRRLPYGQFR
jgi:hypothetical protein